MKFFLSYDARSKFIKISCFFFFFVNSSFFFIRKKTFFFPCPIYMSSAALQRTPSDQLRSESSDESRQWKREPSASKICAPESTKATKRRCLRRRFDLSFPFIQIECCIKCYACLVWDARKP